MHAPRSHNLRLPGHGHGDRPQSHARGRRRRSRCARQERPHGPAPPPCSRPVDGHPRHLRRERRSPGPREGPEHRERRSRVDHHELLAGLREPPAAGRTRRGPARSPPRLPDRPRSLHGRVARLGIGDERGSLHPRHLRRERRSPGPREGPRHRRRRPRVDHHELLAGLREPSAAGRTRRGPARSPPRLPHRPRGLHRRLARLGAGDQRSRLLRRPRRTGSGGSDAVPGRAVHHHDHLPGSRPREGARRLGSRWRRRRRDRRPAGRDAH